MKRSILSAAILGIIGLSSSFTVLAVNQPVALCAGSYTKTLTDGSPPIPMWGYALGGATNGVCDGDLSSPGPRIIIDDTNDGVDIVLTNTLPRATSLVIPGTVKAMAPTFFTPVGETLPRVHSFDAEAGPSDGTISTSVSYSWNGLKPGSYMYHSGTHSQVQVQMGLYGALTDNFIAGQAYDDTDRVTTTSYSEEIVLFYYEIDRAIHDSVALGNYTMTDMKSTIDYHPKHFFIDIATNYPGGGNGTANYNDLQAVGITPGVNPLVRFYNAGLRTHIPTVFEADFDIIAEDGKLYPHVLDQYSVELPPLKTKDAFLKVAGINDVYGQPAVNGSFRLTDSAMAISNPVATAGPVVGLAAGDEISNGDGNGMVLTFVLQPPAGYVAPVASANHPRAVKDNMAVVEGGSLTGVMTSATANDVNAENATVTILNFPKHGDLIEEGNGDFSYQNDGSEHPQDSIVYQLTNADGEKSIAGIMINVSSVNDAPVANNDTVSVKAGSKVEIRALNNDTDVDSPSLSIQSVGASSLGVLEAMGQVIVFDAGQTTGTEVVSYVIADSLGETATANLNITVTEATAGTGTYTPGSETGGGTPTPTGTAPVATAKSYSVTEGSALTVDIAMLGVTGGAMGVAVSTGLLEYPEHGEVVMNEDGTFVYTHTGDDEEADHFMFEIYNDYGTSSAVATVNIIPKMDPPRVNNDRAKTSAGTPVRIDLLRNDKDKDSALNPGGISITEQPGNGTVEIIMATGEVMYTPKDGFTGKDFFRYRLADAITGELSKRAAKVKVRVK
ncbi:MAG: tandem-95 repeat protein [Gammaproteobacteria bacterium]|jgi:FtsP/CotA-like multicopper oxidase with cupredoxin domain|nr:tandem-95 repeat protein [Gammaproteobacteria bacterium]MBT3725246.1 tandem-95 repeat protein [Gammaproteobacteria bacterium]MBT4195182.1 tandem-95 repeat protein [Gammaproteobacteria bacterium]MBT4449870.1 tandem-95 repeat protein [Gammaproteobacteria bacterium]MBT4863411.1 tandem-95 repeat protein [Gammaproteobacteria bacterium]